MKAQELIDKYISFFEGKDHKLIPSASLVPENDSSVLFTTAGMHPLVPYLLGEPHPLGKRLVSLQKCLRTDDIEYVGDTFHHTFFEMLGNWSLGDYFEEEAIHFSFKFLTQELKVDPQDLSVTVFAGDKDAVCDDESAKIWDSLGIDKNRIFFLPKKDNWWGPAGQTGPCGPDTEMFIDSGLNPCGQKCKPGCSCGKYIEIWNDVFMMYNKTLDGFYETLKQKNVDTGMGVERTTAIIQGKKDNYETELWTPIISKLEEVFNKSYREEVNKKPMRIIADHVRAAVFIIADGVEPSNVERGYVLRRLIRRSIRYGRMLAKDRNFISELAQTVIISYKGRYPELEKNQQEIKEVLGQEEEKFRKTLANGLKEFERMTTGKKEITGKDAFSLYESFGFPMEMTEELAGENNIVFDTGGFEEEKKRHQDASKIGAGKKFAGGLADHSEIVTKYHTATHLLQSALRNILGDQVCQEGSNLTSERLRFDFSYPNKLTDEEISRVENLVNEQIGKNLKIEMRTTSLDLAIKEGALTLLNKKYPETVKVYSVGEFSSEVCGGPHVNFTGLLGRFKIIKEEKSGMNTRRIYAVLE